MFAPPGADGPHARTGARRPDTGRFRSFARGPMAPTFHAVRRFFALPAVPAEVQADVGAFADGRRRLVDGWFFSARLAFALALVGYLVVDALTSGTGFGWGMLLVVSYGLANGGVRLIGGPASPHKRWAFAVLDLAFLALLRHGFLFEALVDPNATLTGLLTLVLVGYAAYSDPRLSGMLALASVVLLIGTFVADALLAGAFDPAGMGDVARRFYSLPLRAALLLAFVSVVGLLTSGLAFQLSRHSVGYTIAVQRRAHAAAHAAAEREKAAGLERLNRMKEAFIAVLAHELRTPLTPLTSALELLAYDVEHDPDARSLLAIASESTERLTRLVQDYTRLADLFAHDAGPLVRRPVRLGRLAALLGAHVADAHVADAPGADAPGEAAPDGVGGGPTALTDVRLAGGALLALLRRARLVTPDGTPIHVAVREDAGWAVVTVSDPTSSLPPDEAERLSDPFGATQERQFYARSTGIELTLAHLAAERLGGRLHVESAPGAGTRVSLHLPPAPAGADALDDDALAFELVSGGVIGG